MCLYKVILPEQIEECEAGEHLVGGEHVVLGVDRHEGPERRQGHDDRNTAKGCQIVRILSLNCIFVVWTIPLQNVAIAKSGIPAEDEI